MIESPYIVAQSFISHPIAYLNYFVNSAIYDWI